MVPIPTVGVYVCVYILYASVFSGISLNSNEFNLVLFSDRILVQIRHPVDDRTICCRKLKINDAHLIFAVVAATAAALVTHTAVGSINAMKIPVKSDILISIVFTFGIFLPLLFVPHLTDFESERCTQKNLLRG